MPITESDPRVFFASERTFLAWLRTGITIIALGFVISRFGLFVQFLAIQSPGSTMPSLTLSTILGVAFVIVGTLAIVIASFQHQRFISTLPERDLPKSYTRGFAILLSALVTMLGIFLAGYLVFTQP